MTRDSIGIESELDAMHADLAKLRVRYAHASDAERQELEDPICKLEIEIEELEDDMALWGEAQDRADYFSRVL